MIDVFQAITVYFTPLRQGGRLGVAGIYDNWQELVCAASCTGIYIFNHFLSEKQIIRGYKHLLSLRECFVLVAIDRK